MAEYVPSQKTEIEFDRTPLRASQEIARTVRDCSPHAVGLANQKVVIELIDEEPTEEMKSALKRFWKKVFVELLPTEEESSVRRNR